MRVTGIGRSRTRLTNGPQGRANIHKVEFAMKRETIVALAITLAMLAAYVALFEMLVER